MQHQAKQGITTDDDPFQAEEGVEPWLKSDPLLQPGNTVREMTLLDEAVDEVPFLVKIIHLDIRTDSLWTQRLPSCF